MAFKKYFGKKAKFMIATIAAPIIAILLGTGCVVQPGYVSNPCVWPGFEMVYMIMLAFMLFTIIAWPVIGLYHLAKYIRSRKQVTL